MNQSEKRAHFARRHQPGDPLVLFNIWDPGSARAVPRAEPQHLPLAPLPLRGPWDMRTGRICPWTWRWKMRGG